MGVAQLTWSAPSLDAFVAGNLLPTSQRATGVGLVLALSVTTALGSAVAQSWRRHSTLLQGAARVLAPALVLPAVPALFARRAWRHDELSFLVIAGAVALLLERLLRVSLKALGVADATTNAVGEAAWRARVRRWLPPLVVFGFVVWYAAFVSHQTVLGHYRMVTSTSDLGEFDNLFFNALSGHPFRAPAIEGDLEDWSALKVHAEFVLYLLLPLYALKPGPTTLLILQSTLVALTAVPVYAFAARRLPPLIAAVPAVALLLLPVVQRPNFYDFHFTSVAMFWVAWTIEFVDRAPAPSPHRLGSWRRVLPAAICFVLALLSREDAAPGLVVLGVFVAASRHNPILGTAMAVTAASYFLVMKFFVMPSLGTMWFDTLYEDLKAPGQQGYAAVISTLVTNPAFVLRKLLTAEKLLYLLHFSVPLACLWWRRPWLWAAALPGFASTLLVTTRPPHWESSFQYTYLWVPYVVVASVLGLQAVARSGRRALLSASVALAFAAVATSTQYGALLGAESIRGGPSERPLSTTPDQRTRYAQLHDLLRQIPPEASVAATEREGPHVSTRLELYSLKFTFGHDPDFLLLGEVAVRRERQHVFHALHSGKYGVIARRGPFTLLKRGADPAGNADLLRELEMSQ